MDPVKLSTMPQSATASPLETSNHKMGVQLRWAIPLAVAMALASAYTDYASAMRKLDRISSDQLRPGARVELTVGELSAYAQHEAPAGVRQARLEIAPSGLATGSALINFNELQRSQGHPPGWLMSKLLEGEHPVSVTARLTSGNGKARVDVQRVTISGVDISGGTLDFLIHNFLLELYPAAAVDRPFELAHHIDRLEVQPGGVNVVIGR
jgi:hypothetical protein